MMTSELIGCQVYDAEGQVVGTVHDLHFRLRVQPDGSLWGSRTLLLVLTWASMRPAGTR
jgi:hypothetical protein